MKLLMLAVLGVLLATTPSQAGPPVVGPGGHYYQVIEAPWIDWADANAAASAQTFECFIGHLAVITSAEEDTFIDSLRAANGLGELWVGGYQNPLDEPDASAGWTWVTGEPFSYSNWQWGEPNDAGGSGSEQYLGVGLWGDSFWNDEGNLGNISGYVIEFEFEDSDPPAITCPENITQCADAGQCSAIVSFTTTADDNCSSPTVDCSPASGTSFGIGTTTVTCTATDGSGNMATCGFTVTVDVCGKCPKSQGSWKNSPVWPVESLTLGVQTYTKAELLALLKTSTTTDASLIVARQLIAAKLNIANGSLPPAAVTSALATADGLLSAFPAKLPYKVKPSSPTGQAMVSVAALLEQFNTGVLTPCCVP